MPPVRTPMPTLSKSMKSTVPIKTERSHEENQERAYIAASRRSDRSLEARVESARRASEIHKKRTGRSLRVTEQDVINEEMYEEEDDDLPLQYRRLTAHLQTNSSDFNRRLSAYLTSHQAMRDALSQALNSSYAQSAGQSNGGQMPQQQQQQQQQHWIPQQSQQFNLTMPNLQNNATTSSPTMNRPPTANWGQNLYSGANGPGFAHQRSASIAGPQAPSISIQREHNNSRRMSDSVAVDTSAASSSTLKQADFNDLKQTSGNTVFPQPTGTPIWDQNNDLGPFATNLPNDARMFLDYQSMSNQYVAPGSSSKPVNHSSFSGMDQTLAPGALDTKVDDYMWEAPQSTSTDNFGTNDYPLGHDFDDAFATRGPSQPGTPGEDMWAFIDNSAFEETST